MADAAAVLRQEIARLEQEISKRRKALSVLTGSGAATKSAAMLKQTPATPQSAPRGTGVTVAAAPALASRILTHLTANKGKRYSAVQISEALGNSGPSVTRDNVQRRLSELVKAKKLTHKNGQYSTV